MADIQFYRGNRAKYDASSYTDGIYFAPDTGEILVNDVVYGNSLSEGVMEDEVLKFTLSSGDSVNVTLIEATTDQGGLMSAEDKQTINNISWYEL